MSGTLPDVILSLFAGSPTQKRQAAYFIGAEVPITLEVRDAATGDLRTDVAGVAGVVRFPVREDGVTTTEPLIFEEAEPGRWTAKGPAHEGGPFTVRAEITAPIGSVQEVVYSVWSSAPGSTLPGSQVPYTDIEAMAGATATSFTRSLVPGLVTGQVPGEVDKALEGPLEAMAGQVETATSAAGEAFQSKLDANTSATQAADARDQTADIVSDGVAAMADAMPLYVNYAALLAVTPVPGEGTRAGVLIGPDNDANGSRGVYAVRGGAWSWEARPTSVMDKALRTLATQVETATQNQYRFEGEGDLLPFISADIDGQLYHLIAFNAADGRTFLQQALYGPGVDATVAPAIAEGIAPVQETLNAASQNQWRFEGETDLAPWMTTEVAGEKLHLISIRTRDAAYYFHTEIYGPGVERGVRSAVAPLMTNQYLYEGEGPHIPGLGINGLNIISANLTLNRLEMRNVTVLDANGDPIGGGGGGSAIQNNWTATVEPTLTADSIAGYTRGSQWFIPSINQLYGCVDATPGAAVWRGIGNYPITPPIPLLGGTFNGFGDSFTEGTSAVPAASRWVNLLATDWGATATNRGIGGTMLQNGAMANGSPQTNNGRDRYVSALLGSAKRDRVIVAYGFNDARYVGAPLTINVVEFERCLREVIAGLLAGGYTRDKIILVTPWYITDAGLQSYGSDPNFSGQTRAAFKAYLDACRRVAYDFETLFVDAYTGMLSNGGANLILPSDNIHPTVRGNAVIRNLVLGAKYLTQYA